MSRAPHESVAIDTVPLPERAVRVKLPAKIAYDLPAFQKVQASILARLGCDECTSGHQILYDVVRDFVVDGRGDIHDLLAGIVVTDG